MRVFHYQGGERTLTKFNPGCLELKPEIQSTQFREDQMPLSKELMHVAAVAYRDQMVIFIQD